MAEFNIQSDSVDVTRIMEQIRNSIREKRGADYTEQQIRELASVKLERFLDSGQVRSDLVEHYRRLEPPDKPDPFSNDLLSGAKLPPRPEVFKFDQDTIYVSSRGPMGKLIRLIRKFLSPLLKLFFNPTPMVFALTRQTEINDWTLKLLQGQIDLVERSSKKFAAREKIDALNFEVMNNLVVEMTRLSVDMKNHSMRVESVAGRLDFAERRAQAVAAVGENRSPQLKEVGTNQEANDPETGTPRPRRRRPPPGPRARRARRRRQRRRPRAAAGATRPARRRRRCRRSRPRRRARRSGT